jgi:NAD-dependent SIR2 family protein deacetylase
MTADDLDDGLDRIAVAIEEADALLIGAGAGMGVDSGLPDFRGTQGFWNSYPPYAKLGLDFVSLANPRWFATDPALAWGFYGHRMHLYRDTAPHAGYSILRQWAERMRLGSFVFTSNVDGHFAHAGIDSHRIVEVHGSLEWMQCTKSCGGPLFSSGLCQVAIIAATFRAVDPLPVCPRCGALARPNVLMFGDWGWDQSRTGEQMGRLAAWMEGLGDARLVVIECGAGRAVPTVRHFCENASRRTRSLLVRINLREPEVPDGGIGVPLGALDALQRIDARLRTT